MLAFFVYDLLGFCAREFPEKSEKNMEFYRWLYIVCIPAISEDTYTDPNHFKYWMSNQNIDMDIYPQFLKNLQHPGHPYHQSPFYRQKFTHDFLWLDYVHSFSEVIITLVMLLLVLYALN